METLFEFYDAPVTDGASLRERFLAFHNANPHVYAELRNLALGLKRRGHKKIGIAMLFEQMRWQWYQRTTDVSGFKLCNNHAAYYARMLMRNEPELKDFFAVKAIKEDL